jgi:hypothetical protein
VQLCCGDSVHIVRLVARESAQIPVRGIVINSVCKCTGSFTFIETSSRE